MKTRVDLWIYTPATGMSERFPCWEFDGERVTELNAWADEFRERKFEGKTYTPEDGMEFMQILHKTVRGSIVGATEPYGVEEGEE